MILRQGYAGPRPHAIARHPGQPGGAAAPAHTGPAGISPPHRPLLGVQLPQQPSQPRAGRANRRAQPGNNPGNPARSRRACHRSAPRDMTTQTGHSPQSVSWTGRERLRCLWYRLRLTVAEMNYANRRMLELQAPWIADPHRTSADRPR